jgi:hypothetical protein
VVGGQGLGRTMRIDTKGFCPFPRVGITLIAHCSLSCWLRCCRCAEGIHGLVSLFLVVRSKSIKIKVATKPMMEVAQMIFDRLKWFVLDSV